MHDTAAKTLQDAAESLDARSADSIDTHLQQALRAEDPKDKDFHVRQARQLLEIYTD
jgi:hypothetical protein